jgi:hypothetical protein
MVPNFLIGDFLDLIFSSEAFDGDWTIEEFTTTPVIGAIARKLI